MKLKFLESLMDKTSNIDDKLAPIYKANFEPVFYDEKLSDDDLKNILPINSYVAWYDDDGKFDNIYKLRFYEDRDNTFEIAFFQPITSFFNGWWVPARGLIDDINEKKIIPVRKKGEKDFSKYSGEDTELDD